MSAQWLDKSSDYSSRLSAVAASAVTYFSQPNQLQWIRRVLMFAMLLWALLAVVRIVWSFVPQPDADVAPGKIINPVSPESAAPTSQSLDIKRLQDWHLFGEAGAAPPQTPVIEEPAASAREGIEKGARETRLNVKLRGIVASSDDGLGHAVIEHRSKQAVYAVEDKLPLPGRVTLAKVMPQQVILDNGGTYERLELFDKSELESSVTAPAPKPASAQGATDKRSEAEITDLASEYRNRLYSNPQSLAEVVNVSAVRENGALRGYRVSPGKDREQFTTLGFEPGDLVTSVNGVPLDNPANTMKLYTMLRSAGEITFELQRNSQPHTLSVSLDSATQ